MTKLIDIEGIGPVFAEKLRAAGLHTTEDLLRAGASATGRADLAESVGISEHRILEWVNRADLMRVKGVGEEYSDLLELAGVDSVPELARRDAGNLHAKMVEVNATKKAVRRLPTETEVADWISEAKHISALVMH